MHGINRAAAIALAAILALSSAPAAAQSASGAISGAVSRGVSGAIGGAVASRLAKPALEIQNGAGPVAAMAADPTRRHIAIRLADGSLRLWDLDRGSQRRIPIQGGGAMAVFPDGATIALAAANAVQLVDSRGGAVVATIPTASQPGAIAVSPDGATLAAADAQGQATVWDIARHGARQALSLGGPASALAVEGDRLVAADAKGQIRVFDLGRGVAVGAAEQLGGPALALAIAGGAAVAIGADGTVKRIELATGKAAQGTRASRRATQAAIDPRGHVAALGDGEGRIALVDIASGQARRTIDGPKAPIQGLMFNPPGTRLISAGADGILRVWDVETGKALVQLVSTQSGWSAIDLDGRFDGSEGGLADVRWRVDQAAVPLDQLARRYFEPGLLAAYLGDATPDLAATPGNVAAGLPTPPKVEIDLPEPPTKAGEPYTVIVVATDQGGGIGGVRLYHNGKIVDPGAFVQQQEAVKDKTRIRAAAFRITPVGGLNTLRAAASAQWDVEGVSERVELRFPGDPPRGTLHVLTIGINKYKDRKLALDYSVPDATAIQDRVKAEAGGLYARIVETRLFDGQATAANIRAQLKRMAETKQEDSVVVYLAGHGIPFRDDWMFLPWETPFADSEDDYAGKGVTAAEIQEALVNAKAQRILVMIDSCHSGGGIELFNKTLRFHRRFFREISREAGVTVLAAARPDQQAAEFPKLGHGAFTYTVLAGIGGKAAAQRQGLVTAHGLADYASVELPALTQRLLQVAQEPMAFTLGADFALGRAK